MFKLYLNIIGERKPNKIKFIKLGKGGSLRTYQGRFENQIVKQIKNVDKLSYQLHWFGSENTKHLLPPTLGSI